jgi:hypothetical protein
MQFHIQKDEPNENWPLGAWSLYQITGAEIAERTIWERIEGKLTITERWPWNGYIGMFVTLDEVMKEIERLTA